jgi:excisionase family DNA binding protein
MKSNSAADIGKQKTSLGGVVKVDLSRRLIDGTLADVDELIAARLEEFHDGKPKPLEDGALDRAGAATYLNVSPGQIDKLCREHGLPFHRVGDVKRFFRDEIRAWVKAQGK